MAGIDVRTLAKLDAPALTAYTTEVRKAWEAVAATGEILTRDFCIGKLVIRIHSVQPDLLVMMTEAFSHLLLETGGTADLTIYLWDSAATGTDAPPSPLAWYSQTIDGNDASQFEGMLFDVRGELAPFNSPQIRTFFNMWPHKLQVLDVEQNEGFYWVDNGANMPEYEKASPFWRLVGWWMDKQGRLAAHAGAVGLATGGVLLVGKGGSGKSTSALACLASDFLYVGDDRCLVAMEPEPYVYSIYSSAKIKPGADLERVSHIVPWVKQPELIGREKVTIYLPQWRPQQVVSGFPLRAVLLPRVTGAKEARLVAVSPAVGLSVMAPSTMDQLPGVARSAFQIMTQLVRRLPCFALEVGPNVASIPVAIRQFLDG